MTLALLVLCRHNVLYYLIVARVCAGQDGKVLGPAYAWLRERGPVLGRGTDGYSGPGLACRLLLC